MQQIYGAKYYGKTNISSRFGICDGCRSYTKMFSYETARFFQLFHAPIIPLGHVRITDECPICGYCNTIAKRKYRKKRARDFDVMMNKLKELPEYPDHVLNGLRTLMTYNEESWFTGMASEYARLFENHVQFQMVISEGLCRFGHYDRAEKACLKAIELEAGKKAEELLSLCWAMEAAAKEQTVDEKMTAHKLAMYFPYLTTPFIITLVASLVMIKGIIDARVREVWLVNGSQRTYVVKLDSETYSLEKFGAKKVKLKFGEHTATLTGSALPSDTFSLRYEVPTYNAVEKEAAMILNLDQMALLIKETIPNEPDVQTATQTEYSCGKSLYMLTGINFPFVDTPDKKQLKKLKSKSYTKLSQHIPASYTDLITLLKKQKPEAVGNAVRYALLLQPELPDTPNLLPLAVADLSPDAALLFLRRGLDYTPLLTEWHIFYQDFIQQNIPAHDLQTEYANHCKKNSDIPIYYYLLGRVVKNRTDAWLLFEKAEEGEGIGGFGYNAIAYDCLCTGAFEQALQYAEKAIQKAPANKLFAQNYAQAQLAAGKYEDLLQLAIADLTKDPLNGQAAAMKVRYLTLLGKHNDAVKAAAEFSSIAENQEVTNEAGIIWSHYLDATRYYAVGNITDYLNSLLNSKAAYAEYEESLHTGKIEKALELFTRQPQHTYTDFLLLYCAAKVGKHEQIATAALESTLLALDSSNWIQRQLIDLLSRTTAPSAEELNSLMIPPDEKTIVAAALGFKFTGNRKICFSVSQKFNCNPFFPSLLINKWTK